MSIEHELNFLEGSSPITDIYGDYEHICYYRSTNVCWVCSVDTNGSDSWKVTVLTHIIWSHHG